MSGIYTNIDYPPGKTEKYNDFDKMKFKPNRTFNGIPEYTYDAFHYNSKLKSYATRVNYYEGREILPSVMSNSENYLHMMLDLEKEVSTMFKDGQDTTFMLSVPGYKKAPYGITPTINAPRRRATAAEAVLLRFGLRQLIKKGELKSLPIKKASSSGAYEFNKDPAHKVSRICFILNNRKEIRKLLIQRDYRKLAKMGFIFLSWQIYREQCDKAGKIRTVTNYEGELVEQKEEINAKIPYVSKFHGSRPRANAGYNFDCAVTMRYVWHSIGNYLQEKFGTLFYFKPDYKIKRYVYFFDVKECDKNTDSINMEDVSKVIGEVFGDIAACLDRNINKASLLVKNDGMLQSGAKIIGDIFSYNEGIRAGVRSGDPGTAIKNKILVFLDLFINGFQKMRLPISWVDMLARLDIDVVVIGDNILITSDNYELLTELKDVFIENSFNTIQISDTFAGMLYDADAKLLRPRALSFIRSTLESEYNWKTHSKYPESGYFMKKALYQSAKLGTDVISLVERFVLKYLGLDLSKWQADIPIDISNPKNLIDILVKTNIDKIYSFISPREFDEYIRTAVMADSENCDFILLEGDILVHLEDFFFGRF